MIARPITAFPALVLALMLVGCDTTGPDNNPMLGQLAQAEQRWRDRGVTSYTLSMQVARIIDDGTRRMVITVANRQITSIVNADTGEPFAPSADSPYRTVEGMFDLIREAINQRVPELQVEYNREYGYPGVVHINYDLARLTDDIVFTITDFAPAGG